MKFDYYCDTCCEQKSSGQGTVGFFACACGGTYRLKTGPVARTFTPYFNESHNIQVNTMRDEVKMKREHGGLLGDYPRQMARMDYTRKHREDIIHDRYVKVGLKYPKGKKVKLDEATGRFVPRHA